MVKQLLEAGANPNIPMPGTWGPPLVFLLKESRMSKELLTAFLEAGADPNGREVSMGDETPLHSSWANDNGAELTKLLVEAGADPTPVYRNGEEGDPLISQNMDASMVETYLELGADINALDGARNTVLHRVVKSGRDRDQIRMLLSKGADPNIQNIEGNAPLHTLAEDTGGDSNFRYSATSVLIEYGADPEADANFGRYNSTPLRTASKEDNRPVVDAMSSHGYESW
jgi:cytohesin